MKMWKQGFFLLSLCLLILFGACRRNGPTLVDRNERPNTVLWNAPPDSSEYEYLVHLYWRGRDNDGEVVKYIWTIQDTLVIGDLSWNPAERLTDLRTGHFTTRTDSIFSFTAFKDVGGVGVKKNRQAFYIAAIDDNGSMDKSPAAIEFIATIDQLPRIQFTSHINGVSKPYVHLAVPEDTVGMYRPFALSYHGTTTNGQVRAYRFRPLAATVTIPGAGDWTEDLGDTIRAFINTVADPIPAGVFRLSAQCRDDANAESPVDAGRFTEGVAEIVVNFDPDTRIEHVQNNYTINKTVFSRAVDFQDAIPDTVPYQSWLRIDYSGWDDSRDSSLCAPPQVNPDRCINFQVRYNRVSAASRGSFAGSAWLPRSSVQNTDLLSASDSNTVNIGTVEYNFFVRAIDENGTADGTPATVPVVGNFDPTLDSSSIENYDGSVVNPAILDTLTWNWWAPADSGFDLSDVSNVRRFKTFSWSIKAMGHDNPLDPDGSGVKAWRYRVYTGFGGAAQTEWPLARAGATWVAGFALNQLDDKFEVRFLYPITDIKGDAVFAALPGYLDKTLTVLVQGRDTATDEPSFDQYVFLNGNKQLENSYPTAQFGRVTVRSQTTFYFRMVR